MKYFVIDGFNLAYRAHNVNYELSTSEGMPTGMFYGFLRTILSLKKRFKDYTFVVTWDNKDTKKYEIQPDYKAGRTPLSENVKRQIPDIKNMLKYIGVDQYEKEGYEADDIIATITERYKKEGAQVLIYTNDKDMLQLVEDGKVTVFRPKVGNIQEKFFDEEAVKETFNVPAEKLASYRSFDGDNSDNIKGVPRVPRKILAQCVNEYGLIGVIYSNIENIKLTPYQKRMLQEFKNKVEKNYKIICLNRYIDDIKCDKSSKNEASAEDLLKKYEIKSIKTDTLIEAFSVKPYIKYTDPQPVYKMESYSLF